MVERFFVRTAAALAISLCCTVTSAEPGTPKAGGTKASSARGAREDAARSIPFDRIPADVRGKVSAVVSHPSIFRRMPTQVVDCDPELHEFLVLHPEVVVDIWRVLGLSRMTLERTAHDQFTACDGEGTTCQVWYVHHGPNLHVIYSEGMYEGPLFPRKVRGKCVMVLRTANARESNGRHYVTNRLDAFLQVDNVGLELLARTLQPLVNRTADYNFTETTAFLGSLSRTAETNAAGVQRLATRLTHVEPETRSEFAAIAAAIADNSPAPPIVKRAAGSRVETTRAQRR